MGLPFVLLNPAADLYFYFFTNHTNSPAATSKEVRCGRAGSNTKDLLDSKAAISYKRKKEVPSATTMMDSLRPQPNVHPSHYDTVPKQWTAIKYEYLLTG
jgi:hypothetical protein